MKKTIFIIALAATVLACNNNSKQNEPAVKEAEMEKAVPTSSSSELYEKEWKLSELNGKPVVLDTTFQKYPHLIFQKENQISGNLGCNGFGGKIKFETDNNTITISDIIATQMACPNLKVEQDFLDVLNNAKSYSLENNVLLLSNSKKQISAKLEVTAK